MGEKFPAQEKLFLTAYKPILDVLQRDFLNWNVFVPYILKKLKIEDED
jgi:hypothetical protein